MPTANRKKRADGLYKASITVGRKPDGKPLKKYVYAKTIKELDARAAEYAKQLKQGTLSCDEDATFGEVAEKWISITKIAASEKVKKRYKSVVDNHLKDLLSVKCKDLKPMNLQAVLSFMASDGYAQKTIKEVKQTAVQILAFALDNDIVFRNVFDKVTIPKAESEEREPITDRTRQLIMKTWQGHRLGVPVLIMLYCGLRRGELLALTWNDIDLQKKTLTINKATEFNGNRGSLKTPKTKAGNRSVPIPDAIIAAIASCPKTSVMVCPAQRSGGMMSEIAFKRAWESYQHYLNIQAGGVDASRSRPKIQVAETFTAHQLRHTYATMLYDAGVDILTAQRLLGHANVQTTMRIYTHLSRQKESKSISMLNEHINSIV